MADRKPIFDAFRVFRGGKLTQSEVTAMNAFLDTFELPLTISERGIALMHEFEGYRDTTYPDPGTNGKPYTGGWGTTRDENGKPFAGAGIKHARWYWETLFKRDLQEFEGGVRKLTAGAKITQGQHDALVSFAYNLGLKNLAGSTLLRKHLSGDYAGAKAEFAKWNKAAGKVLPGLVRRRAAEAELYGE